MHALCTLVSSLKANQCAVYIFDAKHMQKIKMVATLPDDSNYMSHFKVYDII